MFLYAEVAGRGSSVYLGCRGYYNSPQLMVKGQILVTVQELFHCAYIF
jgi:hypothetical protein